MRTWFKDLAPVDTELPAWVEAGYTKYTSNIYRKIFMCLQFNSVTSFSCTRTKGHGGNHVAHSDINKVLDIWS